MYVRTAQWRERELTSGWVLRNFGTPTLCMCSPHRQGESHGSRSDEEQRIKRGCREGMEGGTTRRIGGVGGWYLETTIIYLRVYQSWHFAWKSISTVRRCHIVYAILHASPGYSLSGMYLAPATDPCYTTRAIRDGRSFNSAIHASRHRASHFPLPLTPVFIFSQKIWGSQPKMKCLRIRWDHFF